MESKNFGASGDKPSGVVQVFRTSERIAGSTGRKTGERQRESHKGRAGEDAGTQDHDQHTTGHGTPPEQRGTQDHDQHTTEKERNTGKAGKPAYIGKIADNEKKYKKVKKNL